MVTGVTSDSSIVRFFFITIHTAPQAGEIRGSASMGLTESIHIPRFCLGPMIIDVRLELDGKAGPGRAVRRAFQ